MLIIENFETIPTGWISFDLQLSKLNHSILIEFININDFEKIYRHKLNSIIEKNKLSMEIKNTTIYYLPVELIFIIRLAIVDWRTYIHKTNAHIRELKISGVKIDREKFNKFVRELNLEDRASLIKFD